MTSKILEGFDVIIVGGGPSGCVLAKDLSKAGKKVILKERGGLTFGHPGGSCPIGEVVDENLETEIRNCFVCDISSLPGAPSKPPVLTLVTLTKWFGTQLLKRLRQIG